MGRGTDRLTKSTGIPQLNAMLAKHVPGVTTLDLRDPLLPARIKQERIKNADDAYKQALHAGNAAVAGALKARLDAEVAALEVAALKDVDVFRDWQAVITLKDWVLDGVLINMDDDELDMDTPHDARHDGVVLNVAVQGPTMLRNTPSAVEKTAEPSAWAPQVIDDRMVIMDKVFVGLFVEEFPRPDPVTGARAPPSSTTPSTGGCSAGGRPCACRSGQARRCLAGHAQRSVASQLSTRHLAQGPDEDDFLRLVGVYRLGSVMDNRLVPHGEDSAATINVCIDWWPIDHDPISEKADRDVLLPERLEINWIRQLYGWRISSGITPSCSARSCPRRRPRAAHHRHRPRHRGL